MPENMGNFKKAVDPDISGGGGIMILEMKKYRIFLRSKREERTMKKKLMTLVLCAGLTFAAPFGCLAAEEAPAEAAGEEMSAETESAAAEAAEVGAYGITDTQQEALVESVKTSVKEGFLDLYQIAETDFQLTPYSMEDAANYEQDGTYTGEDPYESARMWQAIEDAILEADDIGVFMNTALAVGMDRTELADMIVKMNDPVFEEDMDTPVYDTITGEKYDLANSIYTGIAKYLNGLSSEERAQVLAGLYDTFDGANEQVDVQDENGNYGGTFSTLTLFDKVICENIQF